jgi:hypothetical protein
MSTGYYLLNNEIPVSELLGGQLDKYGIRDAQSSEARDDARCLTDGENNYLWAYGDPVNRFTRYMPNGRPWFILQAIATEFGVKIYSEYDLANAAEEGEETPTPYYVPLDCPIPTQEEIAAMRADWKSECEALDQEREVLRAKWREERATAD